MKLISALIVKPLAWLGSRVLTLAGRRQFPQTASPAWPEITLEFSDDMLTLEISPHADGYLFRDAAVCIEAALPGKWIAQLTGLEQRYWDFEVDSVTITLHFETFLGVLLFAEKYSDTVTATRLLQQAREALLQRFVAPDPSVMDNHESDVPVRPE